jgi:hypothetical protein
MIHEHGLPGLDERPDEPDVVSPLRHQDLC